MSQPVTPEHLRLQAASRPGSHWRRWGPYVSDRAWGTVREDYSKDGQAWEYFPHDHARSRAYRWNEDGIAGICDRKQEICLALALWNGQDPILKERFFGLTGPGGQSRRGRQGVLLLPRLDADPFLHADAVQVPAAGLPVRRPGRPQSRPHARRTRVRTDRHRHLRRPPLLRRHGRIRQGRRGRPADADHHRQPRPRHRAAARAPDGVVSQHVVVVARRGEARTAGPSADRRGLGAAGRDAAVRHALRVLRGPAAAAVHRERDQHPAPVRRPGRPGLPQGCDQRFPGAGRDGRDQRRRASAPRRQRTTRSTCPPAAST